jgi:hypothetical protein
MEEIEDALTELLSEFNARTGRKIELSSGSTAQHAPAHVVFLLQDLSSDASRILTLCIFDVVEPWGKLGLPEAVDEINEAVSKFWSVGNREPKKTVYIPPQHNTDLSQIGIGG